MRMSDLQVRPCKSDRAQQRQEGALSEQSARERERAAQGRACLAVAQDNDAALYCAVLKNSHATVWPSGAVKPGMPPAGRNDFCWQQAGMRGARKAAGRGPAWQAQRRTGALR